VRGFSSGASDTFYADPVTDLCPMSTGADEPILTGDWPVVFTHERTNGIGVTWLFLVTVNGWTAGKLSLQVDHVGRVPAGPLAGSFHTLRSSGSTLDVTRVSPQPGPLRVFEGRPDPADPSRFIIPIEVAGARGELVGTFIAGRSSSRDPAGARLEAEVNSRVVWSVATDDSAASATPPPTTTPATR
jgi:hypothetical protein